MAPPASNETLEQVYLSHSVAETDIPVALCLSLLIAMVLFFAIYIFCCFEALQGKFDIILDKKTKLPLNKLKFVNPFQKMYSNKRRDSSVKLPLDDELNSVEGNQTDTDTF